MTATNPEKPPALRFVAALSFLAFVLNAFAAIPILNDQALYLGQSASLLAIFVFGWRSALFISLFCAAGLLVAGVAGELAWTPIAETGVAAALLQRRIPIVLGVALFWICIGAPSTYLFGASSGTASPGFAALDIAISSVSGLACASLAEVCFQLVAQRLRQEQGLSVGAIPLSRQGLAVAVSLVTVPALTVSTIILDRSVAVFGADIQDRLVRSADDYAALAELYLSNHRSAIDLLAKRHADSSSVDLFADLEDVQRGTPGFRTLIAIDRDGQLLFGAPVGRFQRLFEELPPERLNVSDRSYFVQARDLRRAYLSGGFIGRGFGSDPIVAVSAPVLDAAGQFSGVVEGSLNLPRFGEVSSRSASDVRMLVTDRAEQVVAATPDRETETPFVELLSTPELTAVATHPVVDVPVLDLAGTQYFVAETEMLEGWRVYALTPTSIVAGPVERFLKAFAVGFVALVALGAMVSEAFVSSITRPLNALMQQISDEDRPRIRLPDWQRGSPEIVQMERALDDARQIGTSFRDRLNRELDEKTRQLQEANHSLQALLVEDALTGINNRRGLELGLQAKLDVAIRERLHIVVAMIDVDHFKEVNDQFGHSVGDECLRGLASKLASAFRRRSDLVARYGGEEFTVVTVAEAEESQILRLEQFRRDIETDSQGVGDGAPDLTVSIGVIGKIPEPTDTVENLLERADRALYVSKVSGRNRLTSYDATAST